MHASTTEQKRVFIKSYGQIFELENALKVIQGMDFNKISISVIGNLGDVYANNPEGLAIEESRLQNFFKELLNTDIDFDSFYNPEMGQLFVVGFLVATFLNPVGKRAIGSLSGGPYGILRGLGVSEVTATSSVKKLNDHKYLLVARAGSFEIEKLEDSLGN